MLIAYTRECVSASILHFCLCVVWCCQLKCRLRFFIFFRRIRNRFATVSCTTRCLPRWCVCVPNVFFILSGRGRLRWWIYGFSPQTVVFFNGFLKSIFRICYCLITVIPFTNAEFVRRNCEWASLEATERISSVSAAKINNNRNITNEDIHSVRSEFRVNILKWKSEWNISFEKQAIYLEILFNLQCTTRTSERERELGKKIHFVPFTLENSKTF